MEAEEKSVGIIGSGDFGRALAGHTKGKGKGNGIGTERHAHQYYFNPLFPFTLKLKKK